MEVSSIDINCKSCHRYMTCKEMTEKYREEIFQSGGDWRAVKIGNKRLPSPVRTCSHAIFDKYTKDFKNKSLLEIGCGPLSEFTYEFCLENNIKYVGLEPTRPPVGKWNKIRYFHGAVCKIFTYLNIKKWPFKNKYQSYVKDYFPSSELEDKKFDIIYGNSTIEHWHESVLDIKMSEELYVNDVKEIYSRLNIGGKMIMNCPIKVHGNHIFYGGRVEIIKRIFQTQPWSKITFEHWRENFDDLGAYNPLNRIDHFVKTFGEEPKNLWILNVVAEK